jgi:hypothetical protein
VRCGTAFSFLADNLKFSPTQTTGSKQHSLSASTFSFNLMDLTEAKLVLGIVGKIFSSPLRLLARPHYRRPVPALPNRSPAPEPHGDPSSGRLRLRRSTSTAMSIIL